MKKILLLAVLVLGLVACGQKEEAKTEKALLLINLVMELENPSL